MKREVGENPTRSRRCNGEESCVIPLGNTGKVQEDDEPESENQPVLCTKYSTSDRGWRLCMINALSEHLIPLNHCVERFFICDGNREVVSLNNLRNVRRKENV